MKILSIRFSNLNALKGDFFIDFENGAIANAGIFAITGPTGSGKTTILDAITLALFGKAARYDEERNPENMLSRGTGSCFSEVFFQCSKGRYSARWDLSRARGKADGKIQTPKRQLANANGDILETKIRYTDEKIVELTGMDYARFLRSVLLAQGRFKEFLDAKSNDRGELLEKITGTEIYSRLSKTAYEIADEKKREIEVAAIQLDGIQLLEGEQIEAIKLQQTQLERLIQESKVALKKHRQQIDLFNRFQELQQKESEYAKKKQFALEKKSNFSPFQQLLDRHEKAHPLLGEIKRLEDGKKKLKQLTEQKESYTHNLERAKNELTQCLNQALKHTQNEEHSANENRLNIEKLTQQEHEAAQTIQYWIKNNPQDAQIENELPTLRDRASEVRHLKNQIQDAKKQLSEAKNKITQLKAESRTIDDSLKKGDVEIFNLNKQSTDQQTRLKGFLEKKSLNNWEGEKEVVEKRSQKIIDLISKEKELRSVQKEIQQVKKDLKQQQIKQDELSIQKNNLDKTIQQETKVLEDKRTIFMQSQKIASLEQHRQKLQENEACPLCGATEHPYQNSSLPTVSGTQEELKLQSRRVEELTAHASSNQQELSHVLANANASQKQLLKLKNQNEELETLFSETKIDLKIEGKLQEVLQTTKDHLKGIIGRITSVKEIHEALTGLEKQILKAEGQQQSFMTRKEELQKRRKDNDHSIQQQESNLRAWKKQLNQSIDSISKKLEKWVITTDQSLSNNLMELQNRSQQYKQKQEKHNQLLVSLEKRSIEAKHLDAYLKQLENERMEWQTKAISWGIEIDPTTRNSETKLIISADRRKSIEEAFQKQESVTQQLKALVKQINQEDEENKSHLSSLSKHSEERGFKSLQVLKSALIEDEEKQKLERTKKELDQEISEMERLIAENKHSIQSINPETILDETQLAELIKTCESIEKQNNENNQTLGGLKIQLKNDRDARLNKSKQIEAIEALKNNAKPWNVLNDLIGSASGNKFSKFAQGLTLAQLVQFANQHLHTLNPRYRINRVKGEDLELEMIDLHQANAARPTKSLSGGESFLVSLALALGLAELAGKNTRIESLFIDEGFGSLDSETLDVALSALENLRLQNRSIGIISHVESLKNRLSTQVQLSKQSDGNSTLEIIEFA